MEKEEFQGERALYLEAFSGDGCFTYDRIVRGTIHIQNCTLSIIGGVQPSRIAPLVRGAMSGTSNDGLLQRLQMTVWPDDICSWRWVDRKPDRDARDAFEDVFRYLSTLPRGFQDRPHVLRFTPEAQNLYREWMENIQVEARSGVLTSTLESHVLKMPKTVASSGPDLRVNRRRPTVCRRGGDPPSTWMGRLPAEPRQPALRSGADDDRRGCATDSRATRSIARPVHDLGHPAERMGHARRS